MEEPSRGIRRSDPIAVASSVPHKRDELLRWDGWGYKDSGFVPENGKVHFAGDRYPICKTELPYFLDYVKKKFGVDTAADEHKEPLSREIPKDYKFPESRVTAQQLEQLGALHLELSVEGSERLYHSHGQAFHEIVNVRQNRVSRLVDLVVWPDGHDAVVRLVALAHRLDMVVIPFGGGTNVTGSVECPAREERTIISLDMARMNSILWLDRDNLLACCEAGIVGQDLERELRRRGYTVGHEPDSIEFSTLGGWVATRASGMKKNRYGNIEDLLVHVRMVTPRGVLERGCLAPRVSCGPDWHGVVLGSEGCLGVITRVTLKLQPLPACTRYGSVVFPDFPSGVRCMREVARLRLQPASIRLMDNEQYKLGASLRAAPSYLGLLTQGLQMLYIEKIKGFDQNEMCLSTLLFLGGKEEVDAHEKKLYKLAMQFGGVPAGEKNGERGYWMTYVIAYMRDVAMHYGVMGDTLETSVPWGGALALVARAKAGLAAACARRGLRHFTTMCRVTQTYDSGCCLYFYFICNAAGERDPLAAVLQLGRAAREQMLALGGSVSHHHGVGKLKREWYEQAVSPTGKNILRAIKAEVDPKNIFASSNLDDHSQPRLSKL